MSTSPQTASIVAAMRLGASAPADAMRMLRSLRARALRRGDRAEAVACLVGLRTLANVIGATRNEASIAMRLVKERGGWFDLFCLADFRTRQHKLGDALRLYREALRECPVDEPDRDIVVSAIGKLQVLDED